MTCVGRAIYLLVILGLAAAAARLGLRTSPIEPSQYTTAESIVTASLAALPVVLLGLVLMRLVWSKSGLLVRALEGLRLRIDGTTARGAVQGVPVSVSLELSRESPTKTSIRWVATARVDAKDALPPVIVRVKKRGAVEEEGWAEVLDPRLGELHAWVPTGGTAFRDAPQLPDFVDDAWLARFKEADADEARISREGARVTVLPATTSLPIRRALLLARTSVVPRLDEIPEPDADRPTPRNIGGTLAIVATLASIAMLAVYVFFSPSNAGFEPEIVALAERCEIASDALGGDVKRKMFGFQPSTTKGKESRGNKWHVTDVLVRGARTSGTIAAVAQRIGEQWLLLHARLDVAGAQFDLLRCGHVAPNAGRDRKLRAKVVEVTGAAPVAGGATCSIVSRAGGNDFSCRIEIRCGDVAIYGASPELGFALCGAVMQDGKSGLVADDTDLRFGHSEPLLTLDEPHGKAVVEAQDRAWKVSLSVTRD